MDWSQALDERFEGFRSPTIEEKWTRVGSRFATGETVSGEGIATAPVGVFVDLGVGFPGLLEFIQFEDAGIGLYDFPPLGSLVSARVVLFNDRTRQIDLTQRNPRPFLDSNSRNFMKRR